MHFLENTLKIENEDNLSNEWFKLWHNVVENNFDNINQNLNNLMKFHFEMKSSDTHPNFSWPMKYVPSLINNYCKNILIKNKETLNILGVAALFADNKTFESVFNFITNNIKSLDYYLYNSELNDYLFFQRIFIGDNDLLLEKYYNYNKNNSALIHLTFKQALLNNYFLKENYPSKCIGFSVKSDLVEDFLGITNEDFKLLDFLVEQKDKDNILNFLDYYPQYNAYTQGITYLTEGNINKLKFLSETLDSMERFKTCPLIIRAINTFANYKEIKESNYSFIYNLNDVFDIPYFSNQIHKNFDELKMNFLEKRKDQ